MLIDSDLEYQKNEVYLRGIALSWVIDQEVVYTLAVNTDIATMFMTAEVTDISEQYPEHTGITVRLKTPDKKEEILSTTEYFGSVILSSPVLINLLSHKYGSFILGNGEYFINNEFVIPDKNMETLQPWATGYEPETGRPQDLCATYCQCDRIL